MKMTQKQMDNLVNAVVTATTVAVKKALEEALSANFSEGRKSANEGVSNQTAQNSQKSEKSAKSKKLTIADFEPKGSKSAKGYENWNSYNAQRTKYSYFVATNGEVTDGVIFGTKWYKKVDYAKYNKAKAAFEKKYHYVKKEDR